MKNTFISNKREVTVTMLQITDKIQAEFYQPYVKGLHHIMTNPFYFYLCVCVCVCVCVYAARWLGQTLPTAMPWAFWNSCCKLDRTSRCWSDFFSISFRSVSYLWLGQTKETEMAASKTRSRTLNDFTKEMLERECVMVLIITFWVMMFSLHLSLTNMEDQVRI